VNADRLRANRRGPGFRAARQWRRPPAKAPTRPPASAPSDLLQRSPPHDLYALSWPITVRHDPGLAAIPCVWHNLEVERDGSRAPANTDASNAAITRRRAFLVTQ